MPQYIAFLRGINVGGHRVKMGRLRELFEEMGLMNVSTFLASGNVSFSASSSDADALSVKIERHLARRLGYDVATFIRSPAQLEAIAAFDPPEVGGGRQSASSLYVIFLQVPATEDLRSTFASLSSEKDEFQISRREIYWLIQGKLTDSHLFGTGLERATRGVPTTMRSMTTLRRLVTKAAERSRVP